MLGIDFVRYSKLVDPKGCSIYTDLFVFWGASHFALTEQASDAYNITAFSNGLRGDMANCSREEAINSPITQKIEEKIQVLANVIRCDLGLPAFCF
ncbi:MAG: hypothetical protein HO274_11360 [Ferrovum myxofaciens]|uniref:hypothetical protein n=1 Tax=Ferrovum myxofaciens TaxID=416213 RepID=UPI00235487A9|nr:hypothetical protein [Ferrovum myxofaciens]QKE41841.1 MAG: hypothetical protein HO274_11360 [Ferrovum myxofaciens]